MADPAHPEEGLPPAATLADLHEELLRAVLERLPAEDLLQAELVAQSWRGQILAGQLWRRRCVRELGAGVLAAATSAAGPLPQAAAAGREEADDGTREWPAAAPAPAGGPAHPAAWDVPVAPPPAAVGSRRAIGAGPEHEDSEGDLPHTINPGGSGARGGSSRVAPHGLAYARGPASGAGAGASPSPAGPEPPAAGGPPAGQPPAAERDAESSLRSSSALYKRLYWAVTTQLPRSPRSLIAEAVEASSRDHQEEDIENVLTNRRPHEYWSSVGSADPDEVDWAVFRLSHPLVRVSAVQVQPFKAFFQHGRPVYAARYVRVRLGEMGEYEGGFGTPRHSGEANLAAADGGAAAGGAARPARRSMVPLPRAGQWSWTSELMPMAQTNELQSFPLRDAAGRPPLCVGGMVRLELLGRTQRQDIDNLFYVCLAHVKVLGVPLALWEPQRDWRGRTLLAFDGPPVPRAGSALCAARAPEAARAARARVASLGLREPAAALAAAGVAPAADDLSDADGSDGASDEEDDADSDDGGGVGGGLGFPAGGGLGGGMGPAFDDALFELLVHPDAAFVQQLLGAAAHGGGLGAGAGPGAGGGGGVPAGGAAPGVGNGGAAAGAALAALFAQLAQQHGQGQGQAQAPPPPP